MNTREDFNKYVRDTFGPNTETATYRERKGEPDELSSVIGMIAIDFANLEDTLSEIIIKMLQIDQERGDIVTSELSFKQKVNLFSSLYNLLKDKYFFNTFPGFEEEYFKELTKILNQCEYNRNQVIHSTFVQSYATEKILRKKTTAKQKQGLRRLEEETSIIELFNMADKINSVVFELDQFQIDIMEKK